MIQKKVCMLGGTAVGKTSLVTRFVSSVFSDAYLTTVGVKISKKTVAVDPAPDGTADHPAVPGATTNHSTAPRPGSVDVDLMVWDIYGEDEFQKMRASYLRGAAAYLLVVDVTRRATLDTARALQALAVQTVGRVPFVLLLNKSDLSAQWDLDDGLLDRLRAEGWRIWQTSAKTGAGVEEAFRALATDTLASS